MLGLPWSLLTLPLNTLGPPTLSFQLSIIFSITHKQTTTSITSIAMTRSHKQNDRDHVGLADGTAAPEEHLPRYFAKSGHIDSDPKKVKKEGGGKGNWGRSGDEAHDYGYTFANARRRSNSSSHGGLGDFKTKFETVETDPVFEEAYHGAAGSTDEEDGLALDKEESAASISGASIDEEEAAKKV